MFLRNMSGSGSNNDVAVPSNLQHLVRSLDLCLGSSMECKWSLSGPGTKTKKKGALQQRYSYPRGRPEYSNTKGVSLVIASVNVCHFFSRASDLISSFSSHYFILSNRDQCGL